jgi:hypothetical protein
MTVVDESKLTQRAVSRQTRAYLMAHDLREALQWYERGIEDARAGNELALAISIGNGDAATLRLMDRVRRNQR